MTSNLLDELLQASAKVREARLNLDAACRDLECVLDQIRADEEEESPQEAG